MLEATKGYDESRAEAYDSATAGGAWTPNQHLAQILSADLDPTSVLDLGCGTGQTLEVLTAVWPDAHFVGVDLSPAMLDKARHKFPGVALTQGSIPEFVASTDERFDVVTAIGCLEFVQALPTVIPSLVGLLRPPGRLIMTYEPLVDGLPGQTERETTVGGRAIGDVVRTTFRWTPGEITDALSSSSAIDNGRLFVSYKRADLPVVYQLLQASI